jgi:hypothetical protein
MPRGSRVGNRPPFVSFVKGVVLRMKLMRVMGVLLVVVV